MWAFWSNIVQLSSRPHVTVVDVCALNLSIIFNSCLHRQRKCFPSRGSTNYRPERLKKVSCLALKELYPSTPNPEAKMTSIPAKLAQETERNRCRMRPQCIKCISFFNHCCNDFPGRKLFPRVHSRWYTPEKNPMMPISDNQKTTDKAITLIWKKLQVKS